MISFCMQFYPWYKGLEEKHFIFDLFINSTRLFCSYETMFFELCVADGGVEDIWEMNRIHADNEHNFLDWVKDISVTFYGESIKYCADKKYMDKAHAVDDCVRWSSNSLLCITDKSIAFPRYFTSEYLKKVKPGVVWHPCPETYCMTKADYLTSGGWKQDWIFHLHKAGKKIVFGSDQNWYKMNHFNQVEKVNGDMRRRLVLS